MSSPETPTSPWHGFVDDRGLVHDRAATVPHPSPYVGARVVGEGDLPALTAYRGPLRVQLDAGAGAIAPVLDTARSAGQHLVALDLAVRDHGDPRGNVRRITTAASAAELAEETVVHVAMPGSPSPAWLEAADELAAVEQALLLDLDGDGLEAWIDAALDRELRFSVRGGTVEQAVAAVLTTARLWGDEGDVAAGRRWCRTWVGGWQQTDPAVAHLEGLGS